MSPPPVTHLLDASTVHSAYTLCPMVSTSAYAVSVSVIISGSIMACESFTCASVVAVGSSSSLRRYAWAGAAPSPPTVWRALSLVTT